MCHSNHTVLCLSAAGTAFSVLQYCEVVIFAVPEACAVLVVFVFAARINGCLHCGTLSAVLDRVAEEWAL